MLTGHCLQFHAKVGAVQNCGNGPYVCSRSTGKHARQDGRVQSGAFRDSDLRPALSFPLPYSRVQLIDQIAVEAQKHPTICCIFSPPTTLTWSAGGGPL